MVEVHDWVYNVAFASKNLCKGIEKNAKCNKANTRRTNFASLKKQDSGDRSSVFHHKDQPVSGRMDQETGTGNLLLSRLR